MRFWIWPSGLGAGFVLQGLGLGFASAVTGPLTSGALGILVGVVFLVYAPASSEWCGRNMLHALRSVLFGLMHMVRLPTVLPLDKATAALLGTLPPQLPSRKHLERLNLALYVKRCTLLLELHPRADARLKELQTRIAFLRRRIDSGGASKDEISERKKHEKEARQWRSVIVQHGALEEQLREHGGINGFLRVCKSLFLRSREQNQ